MSYHAMQYSARTLGFLAIPWGLICYSSYVVFVQNRLPAFLGLHCFVPGPPLLLLHPLSHHHLLATNMILDFGSDLQNNFLYG